MIPNILICTNYLFHARNCWASDTTLFEFTFWDLSGNVEHGLARGKEAVGLDTSDGTSWSLLGNAYLSHFFQVLFPL